MMVGFKLVDASMFFDVCGCSSSGGSICIAAILCPGQGIVWVSVLTKMGLAVVVWVSVSVGVWGKLGGCDACQGCSTGSGNVSHCF